MFSRTGCPRRSSVPEEPGEVFGRADGLPETPLETELSVERRIVEGQGAPQDEVYAERRWQIHLEASRKNTTDADICSRGPDPLGPPGIGRVTPRGAFR